MTQLICGVDVSSTSLDASIGPGGPAGSFPGNPDGIDALAAFCHHHRVTLVAMEATGGYERQAFALLTQAGLDVAILTPRAVRQFASGMGRLEKTDRIDAGIIAWFAEVKGSRPALLASDSLPRCAPRNSINNGSSPNPWCRHPSTSFSACSDARSTTSLNR